MENSANLLWHPLQYSCLSGDLLSCYYDVLSLCQVGDASHMVTELEIKNVQCLFQATKAVKDFEWYWIKIRIYN